MGAAPPPKPVPWFLEPVHRLRVPASAGQSVNPIDAFIAAGLKDKGLPAAGPATKATLLRRVCLDPIGIPPAPAELDVFVGWAHGLPSSEPLRALALGCQACQCQACKSQAVIDAVDRRASFTWHGVARTTIGDEYHENQGAILAHP
jgi:hypothetical protein